MDFVKRYPFFIAAAVVLVAIAPVYFFVIRPVQEQMEIVHGDAMTLSTDLSNYLNMGKKLPTETLIKVYEVWYNKYVTSAKHEFNKLVTRSKNLHKLFYANRIKWREAYKVEKADLENRISAGAVPLTGGKPLDLPTFSSSKEPTDEEMDTGQVAYSLNKELIDILERATPVAKVKGLHEIRLERMSTSAVTPGAAGGAATSAGILSDVNEEYLEMFREQGISDEEIVELLTVGGDTAAIASSGFTPEAVDRAAEQQLLGYVSRPFSIKLKLDPAGIPVLISELFKSEYFIRLNGIGATNNEDGTVNLEVHCDILDFSGAGV